MKNARTGRAKSTKIIVLSLSMQIYDVVIAVAIAIV